MKWWSITWGKRNSKQHNTMVDLSKPSTASPMPTTSRDARVMTHLQHSLVSRLTKLDPSLPLHPLHTSLIHSRLQPLFPSLHTPTHPPYALMIRNAIIELKEGSGSTEEAISEFIRRENSDLPWAHARILSLQLEKLCEIGEIVRAEGGRYVVKIDDDVEKCEGSDEKRKRGKRRRKHGVADSVEEESQEARIQVFGKQVQNQDSMLHLETTCSSQPTALTGILAAGTGLLPAQLQPPMSCDGPSESGLDAAAKISGSLSLNVQECKQDEDPITGHADHQRRERKSSKCKQIADHQGESLLLSFSGDANVIEEKPNVKKIDEQFLSQLRGQGISRERTLHRNAHHIKKKIHPQDQAEDLMCSSYSNKKETNSSSQPAAPNSPICTPKGSPEGIASRRTKLPPIELQQQNSSDIDLGKVSKRKASLTCENVHDDNQTSPKEDLDEDQKPPKRPRGRPPRLETLANYPEESLLHLVDEQSQNIKKTEKQHQYGRGRGRGRIGRVRGVKVGRCSSRVRIDLGRGQGRPPKLNQIAQQCEEHLQQEYQDKQHGRGGGRGTGRGRGRPPKLHGNPIKQEEQLQLEDQGQQHGQRRGRGRPRKMIQSINKCEAPKDQTQQHVRGRGRGRPRKLNQNTNQCDGLSQDQAQGLGNSPSSGKGDNQSLEQKPLHEQSWERCHKSELGEATPAAMLGSESRCGSGDVSQSNVYANQSHWQLQPVAGRDGQPVAGRDGGVSLKANQK